MLGVHHSVIFFIRGYRKGNGEPTFCVVSPNTGGKEEVRKATNQADRREVNPRSRCQVLHHLKKLNSEVQGTFWIFSLQQISGWYLGLRSAFFTSGPSCSCTPSSGRDSSFLRLLRTWRAVGRGIFPLFHLTIVLASLLVHVWMAARSVTVTGTTSRPLPTSSSTCRTGGTLSRIPRAGVLYWDDIDNGTLSIEFSMLLFCPPATSRAAPEIFMCHY